MSHCSLALKLVSLNTVGQPQNKNISFYSLNQARSNCSLCKSKRKAEAGLTPEGWLPSCQSVQTVLCYLASVVSTETIKMLYFYLPDCWWDLAVVSCRGSGNPMHIYFPAENLGACLRSLISVVVAFLPAKTKIHCMLPCCCLCLCSGTVAAAGMEEQTSMLLPFSRTLLYFHKGLPGPAFSWHTEGFCSLRSPDPWLSKASWHL